MKYEIYYADDGERAFYNGYSFRRDKRKGYYLSSKKIGERRKRLHVYVWETETGETLKSGWAIHHLDENKNNNDISNLAPMRNRDHAVLHGETLSDERRQQMRESLAKYGQPAAKEWHGSEEGRKWHVEHGKEVFKNLQPIEYVCTYCGKRFETKNRYAPNSNTFCCENCKAAYRRKSGVDDVERMCPICGEPYKTNKYSPAKYCEKHRRGKR